MDKIPLDSIHSWVTEISPKKIPSHLKPSPKELKILEMWGKLIEIVFTKKSKISRSGVHIYAEVFKNNNYEDFEYPKDARTQNNLRRTLELYKENKDLIDAWLLEYDHFEDIPKSRLKLEWQAGYSIDSIYEGLIQFRPSGVRVSKPLVFNTLVALNQAQIIGKYKRRLSIEETSTLQGFPSSFQFKEEGSINEGLKQLGNTVQVSVVQKLTSLLLDRNYTLTKSKL